MLQNNLLTWIVLITFNVPILGLLVTVPFGRWLNDALSEKTPTGDSTGVTSYSRVTGALGAGIVTSFFWAIGNIVLTYAVSPDKGARIAPMIDAVSRFFLIGSALFLPYAFNQLKTLFPWASRASTAQAALKAPPSIPQNYGADEVTRICVMNLSASIDDARMQAVVDAINVQVSQDFAREWGHSAKVVALHGLQDGSLAPVATSLNAVIYIGDSASDPLTGAEVVFGRHRVNDSGKPYGFVYLDVCRRYGEDWSVTLSHEVLELLADPTAVMTVADARPNGDAGATYALEVCDPVQGDHYPIGDVAVCNFVNRAFFGLPGGSRDMNHRGLAQQPFAPRPNGYVHVTDASGATHQDWGEDVTADQKAARREFADFRRNGRRAARAPRSPMPSKTPC